MTQAHQSAIPLPRHDSVVRDAGLALHLAAIGEVRGEVANGVRERLRQHIESLLGPAEVYAGRLTDSRARDIVTHTIEHARSVATHPGDNPLTSLRLLGKSAETLARYSASVSPEEHTRGGHDR